MANASACPRNLDRITVGWPGTRQSRRGTRNRRRQRNRGRVETSAGKTRGCNIAESDCTCKGVETGGRDRPAAGRSRVHVQRVRRDRDTEVANVEVERGGPCTNVSSIVNGLHPPIVGGRLQRHLVRRRNQPSLAN